MRWIRLCAFWPVLGSRGQSTSPLLPRYGLCVPSHQSLNKQCLCTCGPHSPAHYDSPAQSHMIPLVMFATHLSWSWTAPSPVIEQPQSFHNSTAIYLSPLTNAWVIKVAISHWIDISQYWAPCTRRRWPWAFPTLITGLTGVVLWLMSTGELGCGGILGVRRIWPHPRLSIGWVMMCHCVAYLKILYLRSISDGLISLGN